MALHHLPVVPSPNILFLTPLHSHSRPLQTWDTFCSLFWQLFSRLTHDCFSHFPQRSVCSIVTIMKRPFLTTLNKIAVLLNPQNSFDEFPMIYLTPWHLLAVKICLLLFVVAIVQFIFVYYQSFQNPLSQEKHCRYCSPVYPKLL